MTIDHRRPSLAFALVALLCAVVIATAPGIPRAEDLSDLATGVGPFEGLLDGPVEPFGEYVVGPTLVEEPDVGSAAEATAPEPATTDFVPVAEAAPVGQDVAPGIALVPDGPARDGSRSSSAGDRGPGVSGDRGDGNRAEADRPRQAGPSTGSGGDRGNEHAPKTPGQGHSSAPGGGHGPKVKAGKPGKSGSHAQGHSSQKRKPPAKASHQRKAGHQRNATHARKGPAQASGHRTAKASKGHPGKAKGHGKGHPGKGKARGHR